MPGGVIAVASAVLALAVAVAVIVAIVLMRRRQAHGSACCGEKGRAVARMRVADRNKAHYPFCTELGIGGMTCSDCAVRVENALNALPGTWAKVSLSNHTALVRTKEAPSLDALRDTVRAAGYVVLD
mgnify:CR=1 FL=1